MSEKLRERLVLVQAAELSYCVRQGHTYRLPELLAYEFVRWAGFQVARRGGAAEWPATGTEGVQ